MGIITTFVCPPIPDRSHDWHAHFDWQDADDLSCEGYGETEESAVCDLLRSAAEIDCGDGAEMDEILDLAVAGWTANKEQSGIK
jgi:hypothetical protein